MRLFNSTTLAALSGAAMLALPIGAASALTLSGPSLERQVSRAQVQEVYYRYHGGGVHAGGFHGGYGYHGGGVYHGGYGYHGGGYGYGYHGGYGYGVGAAAAVGAAAVGAAVVAPHCWINGYGVQVCN